MTSNAKYTKPLNNTNNKDSIPMNTERTEDWMTSKWRPLMAMTYMATIWFDFIVGPVFYNVLQYLDPQQTIAMWVPLTLQGGGLYHLAMGAVLGIAAYTRGQEKVEAIKATNTTDS